MKPQDNPNPQPATELGQRLFPVHVTVRSDLSFTRHVFQGEVNYVIRDPISSNTSSISAFEYQALIRVHEKRNLGAVFGELVREGVMEADREEEFCNFIISLHRSGFLKLPVNDDKMLYRKHMARQQVPLIRRITGLLFLRVPLINPDSFLDRTQHIGRLLFNKVTGLIWLALLCLACMVVANHTDRIGDSVRAMFEPIGMITLWLVLIGLKVLHEFGHAYACKIRGGEVPEMGAYLILLTPCAYVDATSAWEFSRVRDRVMVSLGGVYVESFIASFAVIGWAMATPGSWASTLFFQVSLLASIVTIGFNLNPLMRYDGYYLLSDLMGVPNLRARSVALIQSTLKRWCFGVRTQVDHYGRHLRIWMAIYGVSVTLYRTTLIMTIAGVLIIKFGMSGFVIATLLVGSTVLAMLLRFVRYTWFAHETQPVRLRAVTCNLIVLVGLPAAIALAPIPMHTRCEGIASKADEQVIYSDSSGWLTGVHVQPGQILTTDQPVLSMRNDLLFSEYQHEQAVLSQMQTELAAAEISDRVRSVQLLQEIQTQTSMVERLKEDLDQLEITAQHPGRVLEVIHPQQTGQYLQKGHPVATVGAGGWIVRTLIKASQTNQTPLEVGAIVQCRIKASPDTRLRGRISRLVPNASRHIAIQALSSHAGGQIATHRETGETAESYVQLEIRLEDDPPAWLRHGMPAIVQFDALPHTLGHLIARKVQAAWNQMKSSS